MNNIIHFLESFDKIYKNPKEYKFLKFIYFLIIPIICLLECIYNKIIWKNFIIKSMIENDTIFDFLDTQNFEYRKNKFRKMDLLSSNEYYDITDFALAKKRIMKDYKTSFLSLFSQNLKSDVENFVTLLVSVDKKYVRENGEFYNSIVYEVILQSYREYFYRKSIKYFFIWLLIISVIISIILIITFNF